LQAGTVAAEDEGALDGDALAGVAGECIGVADVTRFEVVAAQLESVAAVGDNGERAVLAVDGLDGGAGAILDGGGVAGAEADDPVSAGELAASDADAVASKTAVTVH